MILGTLVASLLGNLLTDKHTIRLGQVKARLVLRRIFNVASSFN